MKPRKGGDFHGRAVSLPEGKPLWFSPPKTSSESNSFSLRIKLLGSKPGVVAVKKRPRGTAVSSIPRGGCVGCCPSGAPHVRWGGTDWRDVTNDRMTLC